MCEFFSDGDTIVAIVAFVFGVVVGRLSKWEVIQFWDKKDGKK